MVICEDIAGGAEVLAVAQRLASSLAGTVHVAGRDVPIRASIGMSPWLVARLVDLVEYVEDPGRLHLRDRPAGSA